VHSHAHLLDLLEAGDLDAASDERAAHLREAEESMIDVVTTRLTSLGP
jgi:DNA-binding GntR family transcriptional regulator